MVKDFGKVSLAKWNGALVVVKRLHQQSREALKEIRGEAERLSEVDHHPNIISFVGFVDGDSPALVTEYAEYGSVEECIIKHKTLFPDIKKDLEGILKVLYIYMCVYECGRLCFCFYFCFYF